MIVADSDVLIDALRGREPSATRIRLELKTGALATTAVNVFELLSGARTRRQRELTETLLRALQILPVDAPAAENASEIRRALDGGGTPIAMADCLIAGVCRSRDAVLLTRNRKHFERVTGLVLGVLDRPPSP